MSSIFGIRGIGFMLLVLCFLGTEGREIVGLRRERNENGEMGDRIQIQEHDIHPSPFKNFLDQGKEAEEENDGQNKGSPEWETVIDPKLYIITEYDGKGESEVTSNANEVSESEGMEESPFSRLRRNSNAGHSLSIVNPLDVLRQRLLLEIARRRSLKQNHHQIIANDLILKNIG